MKSQIDTLLGKYGEDNAPPPAQVYTISNEPGRGNLHMVQKVFEGAFEVLSPKDLEFCKANRQQFDILFSSSSSPKPMTCKGSR